MIRKIATPIFVIILLGLSILLAFRVPPKQPVDIYTATPQPPKNITQKAITPVSFSTQEKKIGVDINRDVVAQSYLHIRVTQVRILKSGKDIDKTQEFRLIIAAADKQGRSIGITCPYGGNPITTKANEKINPCEMGGLFIDGSNLQDDLALLIVGVDENKLSLGPDFGADVLLSTIGTLLSTALIGPGGPIASIALGSLLDMTGGQVKDYFEEQDVIGSQGFLLKREKNWSEGQKTFTTSDNGLEITLDIAMTEDHMPGNGTPGNGTPDKETPDNTVSGETQIKNASLQVNYFNPNSEAPLQFLRRYYDFLDNHQCKDAFLLLSDNYKAHLNGSYADYEEWCNTFISADFQQQYLIGMSADHASAVLKISYLRTNDPKNRHNADPLRFELIKDPTTQQWLIDNNYYIK
jgi:hypothetical protein